MAQRSTIHRFNIHLADTDRQIYEELRMSLARADSETPERLIARTIAYCLWYGPGMEFTGGVGAGDEPDVWIKSADGQVDLWLEVGLPAGARLAQAARHSARVVVLAYGRRIATWMRDHFPLVERSVNVEVWSLDDSFLADLVAGLDRTMNWEVTISGGAIYLNDGVSSLETSPRRLREG